MDVRVVRVLALLLLYNIRYDTCDCVFTIIYILAYISFIIILGYEIYIYIRLYIYIIIVLNYYICVYIGLQAYI